MSDTATDGGDLSPDVATHILEESMASHSSLMAETRGNTQGSNSIIRFSGARKYNQEDPIEAAATEMILNKK